MESFFFLFLQELDRDGIVLVVFIFSEGESSRRGCGSLGFVGILFGWCCVLLLWRDNRFV